MAGTPPNPRETCVVSPVCMSCTNTSNRVPLSTAAGPRLVALESNATYLASALIVTAKEPPLVCTPPVPTLTRVTAPVEKS